ncbi:MAG: hypothetical protein HYU81_01325 [Candidatus Brennerbacteria bacterium]|nr:hypothetical protein [Candidatus Brennerbacteria bacterium]
MKAMIVVIAFLVVCAIPLFAQEHEEMRGGMVEFRAYFDSSDVATYAVAYLRRHFVVDEERISWFVFARANNNPRPPSALVVGLSYAPSRSFGMEAGGGLNGNPLDHHPSHYVRGRLWIGRDMTGFGTVDLYYFECAIEASRHIVNWEARLKMRVLPWFACGFYGERAKGFGPRIDIQPKGIPLAISVAALIARWDTEKPIRANDGNFVLFSRLNL